MKKPEKKIFGDCPLNKNLRGYPNLEKLNELLYSLLKNPLLPFPYLLNQLVKSDLNSKIPCEN